MLLCVLMIWVVGDDYSGAILVDVAGHYFDGLRHEINCKRVYDDEVVAVPQTIKIDDVKEKVMISVRPMFILKEFDDSILK